MTMLFFGFPRLFEGEAVLWHFSCSKRGKTKVKVKKMKKQDGFTMLELLVTVVIFGILASIAIPGFSRWLPNYRIKGAARDVYSNLQLAKMGAVKTRSNWAVVFDVSNNCYHVYSDPGADGDFATMGDNPTPEKTVNFSDYGSGVGYGHGDATAGISGGGFDNNVTFITGGGVDRAIFNSRSMLTNTSDGYVYIENEKGGAFAIGAWSTGIVVMRKWQDGAWQQ